MTPTEYFHALTHAALIDGELQSEEKPVLRKYGERLGLGPEEMQEILAAQVRGQANFPNKLPKHLKERRIMFRTMVKVVVADAKVTNEEFDLLVRIGRTIGLERDEVADTIRNALATIEAKARADRPKLQPVERLRAAEEESEQELELMPIEEEPKGDAHLPPEHRAKAVMGDGGGGGKGLSRGDLALLSETGIYMYRVAIGFYLIPAGLAALMLVIGLLLTLFSAGAIAFIVTLVMAAIFYGPMIGYYLYNGRALMEAGTSFQRIRDARRPEMVVTSALSRLRDAFWSQWIALLVGLIMMALWLCLVIGSVMSGLAQLPGPR